MKQTHRQILDAAYRVSGDRHLAEDVTQEVFLKLLTVRWDPDKIRSGIALLASTAVLTALMRVRAEDRRAARERKAGALHNHDGPAASVDDVLDLREAILGLPEALQACIRLRYYGGLSSEDIAAEVGCSPSTVRERLAKAREMLHRRLRPGSWLLLVLAFAGEASASLPSIEPSPGLLENLSRIGRDGPSMAAIAACGGATSGVAKVMVAVAAVLVAAGLGTWAAWPWLAPGEATEAIGSGPGPSRCFRNGAVSGTTCPIEIQAKSTAGRGSGSTACRTAARWARSQGTRSLRGEKAFPATSLFPV